MAMSITHRGTGVALSLGVCIPDPPPERGQIPLGFWESCCGFLPLVSSSIPGSSSGFSPRLSLPRSPRAALPADSILPGV